jgi:Ca2+-binding EF-hand superfamily protein
MELFQSVDTNLSGQISRGEAESLLLRLNIRLGRSYTQADATAFVQVLDVNGDGVISFEEFRSALLKNFA